MEKIASFTVDHIKLQPGIYVSRKDTVGQEVITTFDLRMTSPNEEPVMNTAEMHTIEHLGATFLRNHPVYKDKTIYFGPMGCRTGFYMLLAGDYTSKDVVGLVTFSCLSSYATLGEVPGAAAKDCGNYLDMNLPMANYLGKRYLEQVLYNKRRPSGLSGVRSERKKKMAKIGIIGAMELEVDALKAAMEVKNTVTRAGMEFKEGTLNGADVVVVRSGIGKVNAALCVQILGGFISDPTHMIAASVAGS